MTTFTYGGTPYTFPGNSGVFLCTTTATSGGTQSNPLLLQYSPNGDPRTKRRNRDASVVIFMGRTKAAKETGQYNMKALDYSYSWPPSGTDYAGNPITAAQIEAALDAIIDADQAGQYVQVQDAKGRNLIGTFTSDPVITDHTTGGLGPGSQSVAFSFVEVG